MPVKKRSGKNCYYVVNTNTKKCLSKKEAEKQLQAIKAQQAKGH